MVLGESTVVAVVAAVAGCCCDVARRRSSPFSSGAGSLRVDLAPTPWLAWAVAAPTGVAVALLGTWRSSRRAARVSPMAALREAGVERSRPSMCSWSSALCLGAAGGRDRRWRE